MVYSIMSPVPVNPSPLSVTVAVLVTSRSGSGSIAVSVASSVVLPSLSLPSSDVSVTLPVFPGVPPATRTLLDIILV